MTTKERPAFMREINIDNTVTLDVRAGLASGIDPFQKIMDTLSTLPQDGFLLIINTFEPVPLINVLKRKGFESFTEELQKDLIHTYFRKSEALTGLSKGEEAQNTNATHQLNGGSCSSHLGRLGGAKEFANMLESFIGKTKTIDVRHLEMPMPMVSILLELETLPKDHALLVQHKKIPQMLLPELKEKNFSWLILEEGEGDVKLLIFR